jgi:hypothetical protein
MGVSRSADNVDLLNKALHVSMLNTDSTNLILQCPAASQPHVPVT